MAYLKGRIDLHTNKEIADDLHDLKENSRDVHIILDFAAVEYISSSGIGFLVSLQRQLIESRRKLKLSSLNTAVQRIFKAVGMLESFPIFASVDEAFDSFS